MRVNIYNAKIHFSRLINKVAAGEEITIARRGKPVAKLVPYEPVTRKPGAWRGRVKIHSDFDALPEDLEAAFTGQRSLKRKTQP